MGMRAVVGSLALSAVVAGLVWGVGAPSVSAHGKKEPRSFTAHLDGYQEVTAVSTPARGAFWAKLSRDGMSLEYKLSYSRLSGDVRFSHIHFGRSRTNGGVIVFLCQTDSGPDPLGLAPMCVQEGSVSGTVTADNVVGPGGQGVDPGEFEELVRAMRAGATYVNLHTSTFPAGELRGQIGQASGR